MAVEVGSAYVTVWPNLNGSQWAKSINGALGSVNTEPTGKRLGGELGGGVGRGLSVAKVTIGNMLANAAGAGIGAIRDSLDAAISRVDTLNQFPRVMQNIGFSADEAASTVDELSKGIEGLPTSLDQIVSTTQAFALTLGDLGQAADVALAVNDGLLAFGASSYEASLAVRQLNQMIATNKYDMQSWNSINSMAPGLLDTVARGMLGASGSAAQLREALNSGQISTDQFLDALVKLDTEGGNGVTAFSETARTATGGIKTSMDNVKTAITKNLANIIDALNGSGAISDFFDGLKDVINKVGGGLTIAAQKVGEFIGFLTSGTPQAQASCAAIAVAIGGIGVAALSINFNRLISEGGALSGVFTGLSTVINRLRSGFVSFQLATTLAGGGLRGVASAVSSLLGPVGMVAAVIGGLAAAFLGLYNTNEPFRQQMDAIGAQLKTTMGPALQSIMDALSQIAAAVMPPLTQLINALAPVLALVISTLAQLVATILPPIIEALTPILPIIAEIIGLVAEVVAQIATAVMPIIEQIAALIEEAMPTIQMIITNVMGVIKQVIDTVWPAIKIVIETVLGVIQGIIEAIMCVIQGDWEGAWNAIKGVGEKLWNGIKELASTIWNGIKTLASNVWNGIKDVITNLLGKLKENIEKALNNIKTFWTNIWTNVKDFVSNIWNNIKEGVKNGVNNIVEGVKSIPEKIKNFFSNAGQWLLDAGKNIIQGLINGIKRAIGRLGEALGNIGNFIKEHKGPEDYDRKLLVPAGQLIMQGLQEGITKSIPSLRKTLGGVSDEVAGFSSELSTGATYQAEAVMSTSWAAARLPRASRQDGRQITMNVTINVNAQDESRALGIGRSVAQELYVELNRRERALA